MITFFYIYIHPNLFVFIWNICVSVLVSLIMSEDFHGLTPIYKSELGEKTWKKGKTAPNPWRFLRRIDEKLLEVDTGK